MVAVVMVVTALNFRRQPFSIQLEEDTNIALSFRGLEDPSPAGAQIPHFYRGPTEPPAQCIPRYLSLEVNLLERQTGHSPSSAAFECVNLYFNRNEYQESS
jgi:hypothetical protein